MDPGPYPEPVNLFAALREYVPAEDLKIFDVLRRFNALTCPTCGVAFRRDDIHAQTFQRGNDTPRYQFYVTCRNRHTLIHEADYGSIDESSIATHLFHHFARIECTRTGVYPDDIT